MRYLIVTFVALTGVLAMSGASAQGVAPQGGATPAQGSMCGGPGGMCGMGAPAQGTAMPGMSMPGMSMPGMAQGQQGGMTGGCPMMQRMAAMDTRLRQLEGLAGVPVTPTPPGVTAPTR